MTNESAPQAKKCPLCGGDNNCGNVAGKPHGTCWCSEAVFPKGIFGQLPPDRLKTACICPSCLDRFRRGDICGGIV